MPDDKDTDWGFDSRQFFPGGERARASCRVPGAPFKAEMDKLRLRILYLSLPVSQKELDNKVSPTYFPARRLINKTAKESNVARCLYLGIETNRTWFVEHSQQSF